VLHERPGTRENVGGTERRRRPLLGRLGASGAVGAPLFRGEGQRQPRTTGSPGDTPAYSPFLGHSSPTDFPIAFFPVASPHSPPRFLQPTQDQHLSPVFFPTR